MRDHVMYFTEQRFTARVLGGLIVIGAFSLSACDRNDPVDADPEPFDVTEPGVDSGMIDMGTPLADMRAEELPDMKAPELDMKAPELDMREPTEPDMKPPEVDLGPPLREVVEFKLMGDMPVNNKVKDPVFTSLNRAYTWVATPASGQGFSTVEAHRAVFASTPARAPAMAILKEDSAASSGVTVYGEVMFAAEPHKLSVWIGRSGFTLGVTGPRARVGVYGFDPARPLDYYSVGLQQSEDPPTLLDGVTWWRFEGVFEGLAGYGYLVISDTNGAPLYIHAPSLEPVPVLPGASVKMKAMSPTPASAAASAKLDALSSFLRSKREQPKNQDRPSPLPF